MFKSTTIRSMLAQPPTVGVSFVSNVPHLVSQQDYINSVNKHVYATNDTAENTTYKSYTKEAYDGIVEVAKMRQEEWSKGENPTARSASIKRFFDLETEFGKKGVKFPKWKEFTQNKWVVEYTTETDTFLWKLNGDNEVHLAVYLSLEYGYLDSLATWYKEAYGLYPQLGELESSVGDYFFMRQQNAQFLVPRDEGLKAPSRAATTINNNTRRDTFGGTRNQQYAGSGNQQYGGTGNTFVFQSPPLQR